MGVSVALVWVGSGGFEGEADGFDAVVVGAE
jgi:hypothetical protein